MENNKVIFLAVLVTAFVLLFIVFAQAYRWSSIEAVTSRYYELKNDRDGETKRLNAIIHQANGSEDPNS